jgi:hypothetical protein
MFFMFRKSCGGVIFDFFESCRGELEIGRGYKMFEVKVWSEFTGFSGAEGLFGVV